MKRSLALLAFLAFTQVPMGLASATEIGTAFEYLRFKGAPPTTEIDSFTTDGCSRFPDGTPSKPQKWLHCCLAHDFKYWAGGTYEDRVSADRELRACVAATGHPHIAQLMYQGGRYGGQPGTLAPWRWGYGWPYDIGYTPLTDAQKASVQRRLNEYSDSVRP